MAPPFIIYRSTAHPRSTRFTHLSLQLLYRPLSRSRRHFHRSRTLRAEEKKPPQKGFPGQLYESTLQRVQRERAEQEGFNKLRNESGKGRTAAQTFCSPRSIFTIPSLFHTG